MHCQPLILNLAVPTLLCISWLFAANHVLADNNDPAISYTIKLRDCDELWIISTHCLNLENVTANQFGVRELCCGRWQNRTIGDLIGKHQCQTDRPLVMYVHGYRLDYYWARRRGLETYQDLTVDHAVMPPIRFVIWAWPSYDNDRMVINYNRVLRRSEREGKSLGWFLATAGEGGRIGALSYSLGTQVLGGAFENARVKYGTTDACNAVSIGSATNCRWPHSVQQANNVFGGMRSMLVVESREDKGVDGYKKACGLRRPCSPIGLDWLEQYDCDNKIQRLDATCLVGEKHQIHQYLKHEYIVRSVVDHLVDAKFRVSEPGVSRDYTKTLHWEPGNPASNPRRKAKRK